ncbi:MAG: Fe/S biogenesis protein NfuA [Phycisphaerae bacterium]|nr:Fe/S biogenesis protein NfuA [Phycisphaerae bacterium]
MSDQPASAPSTQPSLLTRVSEAIDRIRPAIQMDGGDVRVVSVDEDGVVSVQLQGACVGCPSSTMTLKMGIERFLRANVPEVTAVVQI